MRKTATALFSLLFVAQLAACRRVPKSTDSPSATSAANTTTGQAEQPPTTSGPATPDEPGTLSLLADSSAIADVNGDGADDVVALAEISSPNDDARRVVALDGRTGALLWASPRVQPPGDKPSLARILLFVGAGRVALATGWTEVELFDARTGARQGTVPVPGIPGVHSCVDPSNPGRAYLSLFAGTPFASRPVGGALLDFAGASADRADRPAWCPGPGPAPDDCDRFHNESARATCLPAASSPSVSGFAPVYVLSAKEATVAIGNAPTPSSIYGGENVVVRFDPKTRKQLWKRTIEDAKHPRINYRDLHAISDADVTPSGVLVIIDVEAAQQAWAQRLLMLDLETGKTRWETSIDARPLVGEARVVGDTLYFPRGNTIEVFDARTGAPGRTFGGDAILGGKIVDTPGGRSPTR